MLCQAQNITTLQQHYKRTTDFGYAKTTRQLVGRQPELWNYGITELRIYGITEAAPD